MYLRNLSKKYLLTTVAFFCLLSMKTVVNASTISFEGRPYYINGINVPWNAFGSDAGSHYQWGHLYSATWFETFFTQCQQYGVNCVRWWVHCDGRSTPEFDDSSYVTGLDATFLTDMEDILGRAAKHKVMVMPCLWSFDMTKDFTAGAGKYGGKHSDLIISPAKTKSYIDNALIPMVKKFASTPNLFAWEIINEPEWSVSDIGAGGAGDMVTKIQMQRFCGTIAAAIHENSNKMVTVGSASLKWNSPRVGPAVLNMWSDSELKAVCANNAKAVLDFYQVHYYDWMYNVDWGYDPFQLSPAKTPAWWNLDKPVLVGESPAKNGSYTVAQMIANCYSNGYCGIMPWSYAANDGAGAWDSVKAALKAFRDEHADLVDFQSTAVALAPKLPRGGLSHSPRAYLLSTSRLALPQNQSSATLFDVSGRLVYRYTRPTGIRGALSVQLPATIRHQVLVVDYSSR